MPPLARRGRGASPRRPLAFLHLPRAGGTAVQHHLEAIVGRANVVRIELPRDYLERLDELRSTQVLLGHFYYPVVRLLPGAQVATVIRDPVERSISVWEYLQWQTRHPHHRVLTSRGIRTVDEFAVDERLAAHVRNNQTRLLGVEYEVEALVAALETGQIDLEEAQRRAAEAQRAPVDTAMLARAKRRLNGMLAVGVTEELPAFVGRLTRAAGLPPGPTLEPDNATPAETVALRGAAYGEDTRRRLADLNRFDVELHSFARAVTETQRDRAATPDPG